MYYLCIGKPQSPTKPMVSDIRATQVKVSWTPPEFNGGTPIVGYLIEYKVVSSSEWSQVKLKESTNTHILRGLNNRTKYHFRLSARNQIGSSVPSTLSEVYETLGKFIFVLLVSLFVFLFFFVFNFFFNVFFFFFVVVILFFVLFVCLFSLLPRF